MGKREEGGELPWDLGLKMLFRDTQDLRVSFGRGSSGLAAQFRGARGVVWQDQAGDEVRAHRLPPPAGSQALALPSPLRVSPHLPVPELFPFL